MTATTNISYKYNVPGTICSYSNNEVSHNHSSLEDVVTNCAKYKLEALVSILKCAGATTLHYNLYNPPSYAASDRETMNLVISEDIAIVGFINAYLKETYIPKK